MPSALSDSSFTARRGRVWPWLLVSLAIIAETSLSYVGLGTQPPLPSWGRMLSDAQSLSALSPGLALYPGLAVIAAVLGFNLLGDGLRDLLDPRSRVRN